MTVLDRILLLVYTIGVMTVLFIVGLAAAGWTYPLGLLELIFAHDRDRIITGVVAVVFLALSIRFFLQALSTGRKPVQAVVHETAMGQVRVSAEAVENLVHRVAAQITGIREIRPRIVCLPEGVNVFVRVAVSPEMNIPRASDELQSKVRDYLSEVAGIKVQSVKVLVDSISSESKAGTSRKLM